MLFSGANRYRNTHVKTHALLLGQGHGTVYNLRLQLYFRLGCKSLFHGKSKASKAGCYIVPLKAD